jgi:hypothetical protein
VRCRILYTDDVTRLARFSVEAFGFEQTAPDGNPLHVTAPLTST